MNWVSCHFYVGKMQSTLSVVLCVKTESVNMSLFRSLTFPFGIEGEYYPEVWCQYPKCSGFQNVETHRFDKIPELQRQSPLPAMLIGGDIFMGCHSTNGVTYWLHPGWWYTYPSEKYEFVSWDWWHSQYIYMESHKSHVPNHQPVMLWTEFHVISMLEKCNRPYQWFCAWKLNQWTCRYSDHSPFLSESRVNTIQKFDVSIQSVQAFKTLKLTGSTKFQNYRGKALYQLCL